MLDFFKKTSPKPQVTQVAFLESGSIAQYFSFL